MADVAYVSKTPIGCCLKMVDSRTNTEISVAFCTNNYLEGHFNRPDIRVFRNDQELTEKIFGNVEEQEFTIDSLREVLNFLDKEVL